MNAIRERGHWLLLAAILSVAAFLRLYQLAVLPPGPYYDEAANGILAAEIATGVSRPLFIRSYTGKEVLWFYAVAGVMRILGQGLVSMRLTSALMGIATVGATYWLAIELFDEHDRGARRTIALIASALIGVSFWHIAISRYGFRAISQPLLQALTLGFLWRGMRRGRWWDVVLAGLFCGGTAYTYLASRIVPVALLPWAVGLWLAARPPRRRATLRLLLFALVAAIVVAPLGVFFLRNPEAFGARMSQVSLLNPDLNQGQVWRALWESVRAAFGMFTVRGDPQSRFGVVGRPVFDPVVGAATYLGALVSLYHVVRGPTARARVRALSLLAWVPLLLVPSILGVKEVPHSLRAIGVMPVLYLYPAVGFSALLRAAAGHVRRLRALASPLAGMALAALLLMAGGASAGWDYFAVWGQQPAPYYQNDNDLADAARTLNSLAVGDAAIWVSSLHYRHPTVAYLAKDYLRIRWLVGEDVIAFPPADGNGGVYVLPRSSTPDPSLLALLGQVAAEETYAGPDGDVAYRIYRLPAGRTPPVAPQHHASANYGNQIELLGYDLPPVTAGEPLVVTLYWRVLAPAQAEDHLLFVHVQDVAGLKWGSSDAFDYPSSQWSPGQVIVQRRSIPISPLTPPGAYELVVGFYAHSQNARLPRLDSQGRVAGTTTALGPVSIAQAAHPPATPPDVQARVDATFDGLRLYGYRRDQGSLRPGDTYYLGLYWSSDRPLPDLSVVLELAPSTGGAALPLWEGPPVHGTFPTTAWQPGTALLDQYALTIPQDAPPGEYVVQLRVVERASGAPVGPSVPLTGLDVQAVDRRTIVPPIQHPGEANLGAQVAYLGYDLDRTTAAPGET
ncbi:MAG: hypothetical protein JXA09_16120, partial [Anaerolineae bacterium]|nr:hypothetical protein [Anaerolineae bacterium]